MLTYLTIKHTTAQRLRCAEPGIETFLVDGAISHYAFPDATDDFSKIQS